MMITSLLVSLVAQAHAVTKIDPVCEGFLLNSPYYELIVTKLDPAHVVGGPKMTLKATPPEAGQQGLSASALLGERYDWLPLDVRLSNLEHNMKVSARVAAVYLRQGWVTVFMPKPDAVGVRAEAELAVSRLEKALNLTLRELHGLSGEGDPAALRALQEAVLDETMAYLVSRNIAHRLVSRRHSTLDRPHVTELFVEILDRSGKTIGRYDPMTTLAEIVELRREVADQLVEYLARQKERDVQRPKARPQPQATPEATSITSSPRRSRPAFATPRR